ncbi:MAG: CDP-alcohol phosphatidyltransferase family protein, partial [Actinomycetota bacterium]|nr:CDP-alcohol phosphatidyltransferase family protein [Actinomycetota bacterium]
MVEIPKSSKADEELSAELSHDVWTVANIITVLRLFLVPYAFVVLINGNSDVSAFALYAGAASTDWLDGQIARRTGTVTAIGKAIDPLVDRLLLASGVIGLYIVHRIDLWLVLLLVARDVWMLYGAWRLERHHMRMPVSFAGKVTTALLLAGFSLLILNLQSVAVFGARLVPGTGLVYAGATLSVLTAIDYARR